MATVATSIQKAAAPMKIWVNCMPPVADDPRPRPLRTKLAGMRITTSKRSVRFSGASLFEVLVQVGEVGAGVGGVEALPEGGDGGGQLVWDGGLRCVL